MSSTWVSGSIVVLLLVLGLTTILYAPDGVNSSFGDTETATGNSLTASSNPGDYPPTTTTHQIVTQTNIQPPVQLTYEGAQKCLPQSPIQSGQTAWWNFTLRNNGPFGSLYMATMTLYHNLGPTSSLSLWETATIPDTLLGTCNRTIGTAGGFLRELAIQIDVGHGEPATINLTLTIT